MSGPPAKVRLGYLDWLRGWAVLIMIEAQIRNASVTGKDIKNKSLTKKDFKGSVQGPKGDIGPQGPKGDTGITTLSVRAASGSSLVKADCLPGERATGGGAHSSDGYIVASGPSAHPLTFETNAPVPFQGYTPTSWSAQADNGEGGAASITAWVVCAAPE